MYSYRQLRDLVNSAILGQAYPGRTPELYEPVSYLMGLEGKRLRPVLLLMGCNLFDDSIHHAVHPALGVEMFHNFTLMHDDIMDRAPLRRGMPAAHEKWGQDRAILSGDAMLVEAFRLMMQVPAQLQGRVLAIFTRTASLVCEGQQIDMNFERSGPQVPMDDYLHMIELKTAVLLGASLEIGALAGGAGEEPARQLYEFGRNLGIAFQLRDDYLDVYGDPGKFGKQVGGDILSNKKTCLLITALELAEKEQRDTLLRWMGAASFDPEEKIREVRAIYDALDLPGRVGAQTGYYVQQAFTHLEQLSVPGERKRVLREFAEGLLAREK